jgi:predicted esterase
MQQVAGMMRRVCGLAVLIALSAAGGAHAASLYDGPGQRPGPDLLYAGPPAAPQLANRPPWRAKPILVSGATAYRSGEFLYQDYLYDDNGARQVVDPNDERTAGNLFSKQNGTYTYPRDAKYGNNAADFVELRVKPARRTTAFRVTLNTLKDPSTTAFTIAIGGRGVAHEFPFGANVRGPAELFLTVHPDGKRLVGELTRAASGRTPPGGPPKVVLNAARRQIEIRVSHESWNPRRKTVRLAAGVGLWDGEAGKYLLPQASADATHPGGAGTAAQPAAFFNVAFRGDEPMARPDEGTAVINDPAWWRDRKQGKSLAAGDIAPFHANVSFAKLAKGRRDESQVPKSGPMDRILASRFELAQGADFTQSCLQQAATCKGQYQGQLQPYAIYIPRKPRPAAGYGMTLLMHSLSANYNQYLGTRNQSQFGERGSGSIVITPEARGPDESYENYGAADVFEVWADVARRFKLDPDLTVTTGYSMGAVGSLKLGSQFPDLFARMHPTVGFETEPDVLASLRNVPVLMWNNTGDELANDALFNATAAKLDSLGYRYELDEFRPCAHPQCSPLFPNHLQLAINDQYQPAADFLGDARVDRNPHHVTYVVEDERNHPELNMVGDHAYWVSGLARRDPGGGVGQIDAISHGFGAADPPASATQLGTGTLSGGNLGPLEFTSRAKTWGAPPPAPRANALDIDAKNIARATIDVQRAALGCDATVNVTSDGPIDVTLAGCNRTVHADAAGSLPGLP